MKVHLIPFDCGNDLPKLARWARAPHVAKWWGIPEKSIEELKARPTEGGGDALIAADGVEVGYIRWQRPSRQELAEAGLSDLPEGCMDIDIGIGEQEYLGKGIGSKAIRMVVKRLLKDASLPMIMIAASVDNVRAVKAYEKAGFRRNRQFDDPEYGRMWLFEWPFGHTMCPLDVTPNKS